MTRMVINHLHCDGAGGCVDGWDQDPMIGEPDETVEHMLRDAGWVRRGSKHVCNGCQRAEASR